MQPVNNIPTDLTLDATMLDDLYKEYDRLVTIYEDWSAHPFTSAHGLQVVRTRLAFIKHQITVRGGTL